MKIKSQNFFSLRLEFLQKLGKAIQFRGYFLPWVFFFFSEGYVYQTQIRNKPMINNNVDFSKSTILFSKGRLHGDQEANY